MVFYHTLCVFAPDAAQATWHAIRRYGLAIYEAFWAMGGRIGDVADGIYVFVVLVVALVLYLPRVAYDVLEGVLHGWVDVAIAMLLWSAWGAFSPACLDAIVAVVVCGLYSRLMQRYESRLKQPTPKKVVNAGISSMPARMDAREREERDSVS